MKNIIYKLLLILLLLIPISINAEEKKTVLFSSCIDGDTAKVILNKEQITLRFLAIDTPETKHPTKGEEPFGKEASNYTCNALKNASTIEIEYDKNANILDKYNRHLVWIFVDGELLQEKLIEKGYAKTAYLYDEYKYTNNLLKLESIAKNSNVGIWGDYETNYLYIFIALFIIIILCIFSKTFRNKVINSFKKNLKKKIK